MATADFTISDVLAWARTRPADERYNFIDKNACAIAQFGIATERPHLVGLYTEQLADLGLLDALCPVKGPSWECTFGGLVKRLEALCPETVITPSEWTRLDAYLTDIEAVAAQ
jgi:hypothetical protein